MALRQQLSEQQLFESCNVSEIEHFVSRNREEYLRNLFQPGSSVKKNIYPTDSPILKRQRAEIMEKVEEEDEDGGVEETKMSYCDIVKRTCK
jgi:hypothetical protein